VSQIWGEQGGTPTAAGVLQLTIDRSVLAVSIGDALLLGVVEQNSDVVRLDGIGGFSKILPFESNRFIGISANQEQIISLKFGDDLRNSEKLLLGAGNGWNDLVLLSDQTVVSSRNTLIVTISPGNQVESTDLAAPPIGRDIEPFKGILTFPGQTVFVIVGGKGNLVVCRAPDVHKGERFLQKQLHTCEIVAFCSGEEFSFLTCDAGGNVILWENVIDWWDAPYALDLFKEEG
jgi:hypothetical protein